MSEDKMPPNYDNEKNKTDNLNKENNHDDLETKDGHDSYNVAKSEDDHDELKHDENNTDENQLNNDHDPSLERKSAEVVPDDDNERTSEASSESPQSEGGAGEKVSSNGDNGNIFAADSSATDSKVTVASEGDQQATISDAKDQIDFKFDDEDEVEFHDNDGEEKDPEQRRMRKLLFYFVGVPLLAILAVGLVYGGFLYNKAESVMDQSYKPVERETPKRTETTEEKIDNLSVLLLGVDESDVRQDKGSRTDAMILATFNEEQKSVKLLSIPRDTYVYIPDSDTYSKINHAHSWGGIKSTLETVELLLDIPIDYYVKMNFNAFMEVVEAVGGVEVNVPYEVKELDSKDRKKRIHLQPGWQRLNGEEALAFVRTRKLDTDIERGKRQQEVLQAIMKRAMSLSSITKYADIMEAIGDNMTTDIPFSEMKTFIDFAAAGPKLNVDSLTLKGEDLYINHGYYYELDEEELEKTKRILKRHLGLPVYNEWNHDDVNQGNTNREDGSRDTSRV